MWTDVAPTLDSRVANIQPISHPDSRPLSSSCQSNASTKKRPWHISGASAPTAPEPATRPGLEPPNLSQKRLRIQHVCAGTCKHTCVHMYVVIGWLPFLILCGYATFSRVGLGIFQFGHFSGLLCLQGRECSAVGKQVMLLSHGSAISSLL